MRNSILYIFMSLIMHTAANAQAGSVTDTEFVKELQTQTARIQTITCRFTQTQSLAVLTDKVVKSGTFYYRRPERLRLQFHDGDYIKMTPDRFEMKQGSKVSKIKVDKNPMLRQLKKILAACMTGEVMQATHEFEHTLQKEPLKYIMTLKPKKKQMASMLKEIMLEFDRHDMCLNKMQLTQAKGDYTLYEFFEKKLNTPVKPLEE